jgi:diguanylate cyclase (GGDEF)-like protein
MNEPVPVPAHSDSTGEDARMLALLALAREISVDRDDRAILRGALEALVKSLDILGGTAFLAEASDDLTPTADYRIPIPDDAETAAALRRCLWAGRPQVFERSDAGWLAAIPLYAAEITIGVLALHDRTVQAPPLDPFFLEAVGRQIGAAVGIARRFADLTASASRVETLNKMIATLTSGMELKAVISDFAAQVATVERFSRLICALLNDSEDYIEITGHPDNAAWGLGTVVPVVGSGPGSVVLSGRAIVLEDLLHGRRFIEDMRLLEEGIRSYALIPLRARGCAIGALGLGSRSAGFYGDATIARLQPLADSVALALENARLLQKTRELSITDEVTPLFNFRFFHQMLDRELKLVDRYRSFLSLIFIDLDRFKPINDQHGHLRGSRVLREVGFLLRAAVRETDYPARYGGDEFVIVCPQTDHIAAQSIGEKLQRMIEEHVFLQEEGINARIGASIGVATYPSEATAKEALIRLADARMYEAKGTKGVR